MSPAKVIACGFLGGLGFMASQELWWFLTGMVSLCHG